MAYPTTQFSSTNQFRKSVDSEIIIFKKIRNFLLVYKIVFEFCKLTVPTMSSSSEAERQVRRRRRPKLYKPRINFTNLSRANFIEKFRLTPSEAEIVLQVIGDTIKHKTQKNCALAPQQQLLITLRWLSTGSPFHGIGDMHGMSKSTVCSTIRRVIDAMYYQMSRNLIKWPTNCQNLENEFLQFSSFPSVCGIVDGTLIPIMAPKDFEEQYVDRHGNHSINVMMISGPKYQFFYVNASKPGSVHDSRVLRRSQISARLDAGWRPFPGAVILGNPEFTII